MVEKYEECPHGKEWAIQAAYDLQRCECLERTPPNVGLSLSRLKEIIGAGVPCIPATGAETAAMAQHLISVLPLLDECADLLDTLGEDYESSEQHEEIEDLIRRIGEALR